MPPLPWPNIAPPLTYAQLVKIYGNPTGQKGHEKKYSPLNASALKSALLKAILKRRWFRLRTSSAPDLLERTDWFTTYNPHLQLTNVTINLNERQGISVLNRMSIDCVFFARKRWIKTLLVTRFLNCEKVRNLSQVFWTLCHGVVAWIRQ